VRSTHGVNCTGSCSWKIYVKGGVVTWETQQTDYPRTRWDMPNHEPRGCARGASYSWYLYSANRVKYPMVRGRLIERWREALQDAQGPGRRLGPRSSRMTPRGEGLPAGARHGRLRAQHLGRGQGDHRRGQRLHDQEARPDRIIGFSPIPAMSMVSATPRAAGTSA
jgi:nitrate reductase alpha subunit